MMTTPGNATGVCLREDPPLELCLCLWVGLMGPSSTCPMEVDPGNRGRCPDGAMQASSVYMTRRRTLPERSHFRGVAMVQSRRHRIKATMSCGEEG